MKLDFIRMDSLIHRITISGPPTSRTSFAKPAYTHKKLVYGVPYSTAALWCQFFLRLLSPANGTEFVTQFIALLEVDERDSIFQQGGAWPHTAGESTALLHEFFGERLISLTLWPPQSPDLTPNVDYRRNQ